MAWRKSCATRRSPLHDNVQAPLPLGVWVGVGAVGTAILGMVLFGEPTSAGCLVSLGLIVAGIVGLKLAST